MKTLLLFSILFCAIALPALGQTSENTIETDIAVIKTEIKNLNEKIDDKFGSVDDKFGSLEKRFDSIEKNFDRQNAIMIACVAIPMGLITLLIAWRSVKDNSFQRQVDTLSKAIESQNEHQTRIEELTQEIETLKQQRIVNP